MRTWLLLNLTFALAGCASTRPPTVQTNQAVKQRYWAIQDANRERIPLRLTLPQPERVEDGALRVPSVKILTLPR
jgi:uncharacterized lipoprotein YmbA